MATVDDLGGIKESGDLIISADWMAVVNEVVRLGGEVDRLEAEKADLTLVQALQGEVDQLRTDHDALEVRVTTLESRTDGLDDDVTAIRSILGEYFQLRLSTTRATYAVGSQAELLVALHDLEGSPVSFAAGVERPWVDFVTTYGQFAPATGFQTRGTGQRAMSVQVDLDGEARVLLRGETAPGVTTLEQDRMFVTMQRQVSGENRSLEDVILDASTPVEAGQRGAWQLLNAEYDASASSPVRRYLDNQYTWDRARPFDFERGRWGQSFQDHDSTVLAFLKPDTDPLTPDQSRAISTIQVTWRDWLWPWIDVGYVPVDVGPVVDIRDDVLDLLDELPTIDVLGPRIQDVLGRWLDGRGPIERERNAKTLIDVLDDVTLPGGRPDAEVMFQRGREALELQLSLDRGGSLGGEGSVSTGHMAAMLGGAGRTEVGMSELGARFDAQESAVGDVAGQVGSLENQMQFLGGQVEETVSEGGRLSIAIDGVENLRQEVDGIFETLSGPTDARVRDLQNNVQLAIERIVRLEG